MRAGLLRHHIEIQHEVTTKDEYGSEVTTWETLATRWAQVEPLKGREYVAAGAVQDATTTRFVIRYFPEVEAGMRVVWRDTTYAIDAVLNDRAADVSTTMVGRTLTV